jgi:hypothetical protein
MPMKFEVIDVNAYSGYKHNERPISFIFQGRDYRVTGIIDRWHEGGVKTDQPYLDYFKVKADDGKQYLLRYNGLFDKWSILVTD